MIIWQLSNDSSTMKQIHTDTSEQSNSFVSLSFSFTHSFTDTFYYLISAGHSARSWEVDINNNFSD